MVVISIRPATQSYRSLCPSKGNPVIVDSPGNESVATCVDLGGAAEGVNCKEGDVIGPAGTPRGVGETVGTIEGRCS